MALPVIKTPEHIMEVPSTGEQITYRPFLVGEEKLLLLAMESENENEIRNAVMNLVNTCTFGKVGNSTDPMFDIEFSFLRIRGKSVAETIELELICPDDEETTVKTKIDTEEIKVCITEGHNNVIELNEEFTLVMRYPTFGDTMDDTESDTEKVFNVMKSCINEIHHEDTIYNMVDISTGELNAFFDSMTQGMLEKVREFFESMPKLRHIIQIKNPKTKKKSEVVLEGLSDFLG